MEIDDAPTEPGSRTRWKMYGTLTVYGHCVTGTALILLSVSFFIVAPDDPVSVTSAGRFHSPTLPIDWLWFALGFGVFTWLLPVFLLLMHSPRTRCSDIAVGTDGGVPALLLLQSRLIYNLSMFVVLPAVSVAMWFLIKINFSTTDVYGVEEASPFKWAILAVFAFGYQAVVVAQILLGRVRPGHIAIRHDGIHLRGYAHDAWIPWDSLLLVQPNGHWKYLTLTVWVRDGHRATFSRPALLWKKFDNTVLQKGFRTGDEGFFVQVDRRPFRIAPEIIDAAVEHYIENPEARRELRDPEVIARTVELLRANATTAWWRSQRRPVPLPTLDASHGEVPRL